MSRIDVVLAVVLALFALRGFWRGFSREVFALIGLVGGVAAAGVYYPDGVAMLPPEVPEIARPALAFLGIFLAVALAAKLAGLLVQRLLGLVLLSPLDRLGGVVFGAAKGAAVLTLGVIVVRAITPPDAIERACADSVLMQPILEITDDGHAAPPPRHLPDPLPQSSPSPAAEGV
ncbi:MAG: CvpA family protein [Deltaproteobacteria bacterium]|nr:CvpA family protein [Deltaproteobacteria bacterium]